MASFFENLGLVKSAPDPKIVGEDPQTAALIAEGTNRATAPTEEHAANINANVGTMSQLGGKPGDATDAALGQGPGFLTALRNQYAARSSRDIDKIQSGNMQRAEMMRADKMRKMAQAAMGQQRAMTQNYEMLTQAYNDAEIARAQLVSSIFQMGGQAGGMAMANKKRQPQGQDSLQIGSASQSDRIGNDEFNMSGSDVYNT